MANYTPEQVERKFEIYQNELNHLDSLKRQLNFLETEYEGDDQLQLRANVCDLILRSEEALSTMSEARTLTMLTLENREAATDMLILLINSLRSYFIVDKMISTDGILSLAPLIIVEFGCLTLEEITVCFNKARIGYYGTTYNRLDGQTIMAWLRQYVFEKQERRHLNEVNKHLSISIDRVDRPGGLQEASDGLRKAISAIQVNSAKKQKHSHT